MKNVIDVEDNISDLKIFEIINRCFGKNYKAWMKAWYDVDATYGAWFPKIAVDELTPDGTYGGSKYYLNVVSTDGKIIQEYNHTPGADMELSDTLKKDRFVFGRIGGKFKFLGVYRYVKSEKNEVVVHTYKRIATCVDLDNMSLEGNNEIAPMKKTKVKLNLG